MSHVVMTDTVKFDNKEGFEKLISYPYLTVVSGADQGKYFRMDKRSMTIGRSNKANIVIDDERISKVHCSIFFYKQKLYLEDLNSTNGIYVDCKRVDREQCVDLNTYFKIGGSIFKVEFVTAEDIKCRTRLLRRANCDSLTGAYNRYFFMDALQEELDRSKRGASRIAVALFDLDFFKKINDTYGHSAGDYVLKEFVRLIQTNVRSVDLICRYGGEEFILLLKGRGSVDEFEKVCEKLRYKMEQHSFVYEGVKIDVTTSVGLCCLQNLYSVENIIGNADMALYESKKNGRNMVSVTSEV